MAALERVPDGDDGHLWRAILLLVKRSHLAEVHRPQRCFGANRQVAIGVRAVKALREHPLGDGRWHVAKLQQPVEPQVAHAVEVGGLEAGPRNHLCQQGQRRRRRPLERREPDERRIGADLGFELRAEPAERLV